MKKRPDSSASEIDAKRGAVVSLDERRLLPRHRRGDPEAFGELLACYRAPVYGYLIRCGVPAAERDDLFQDIFVKIHGAAATYQADRPLKPWLFTIVANTVRTWYRKKRVQELVFSGGGEQAGVPSGPPAAPATESPHHQVEAQETAAWLDRALAALPFEQREVLVLCRIEQMEMKEAATVLDLPVGTVKTHLHRARRALTEQLARRNARARRESARGENEGGRP